MFTKRSKLNTISFLYNLIDDSLELAGELLGQLRCTQTSDTLEADLPVILILHGINALKTNSALCQVSSFG